MYMYMHVYIHIYIYIYINTYAYAISAGPLRPPVHVLVDPVRRPGEEDLDHLGGTGAANILAAV